MLISEWTRWSTHHPTLEQWEMITIVYTWHPLVPNIGGHQYLANIYKTQGIGMIESMFDVSNRLMLLDSQLQDERRNRDKIESDFAKVKSKYNSDRITSRSNEMYLKDLIKQISDSFKPFIDTGNISPEKEQQ